MQYSHTVPLGHPGLHPAALAPLRPLPSKLCTQRVSGSHGREPALKGVFSSLGGPSEWREPVLLRLASVAAHLPWLGESASSQAASGILTCTKTETCWRGEWLRAMAPQLPAARVSTLLGLGGDRHHVPASPGKSKSPTPHLASLGLRFSPLSPHPGSVSPHLFLHICLGIIVLRTNCGISELKCRASYPLPGTPKADSAPFNYRVDKIRTEPQTGRHLCIL